MFPGAFLQLSPGMRIAPSRYSPAGRGMLLISALSLSRRLCVCVPAGFPGGPS